jgi:DNA-binding response OmpR family regulator
MRVLVVEDELKVANALCEGLVSDGYDVTVARTGEEGFSRGTAEPFDIILLDLTLPRRDGLDVLAALRSRGINVPVLVITARDSIDDRVAGLDRGADGYLTKPFAFAELLARIRALLRRGTPEAYRFAVGDLAIDLLARTVERCGKPLELTTREFQLLAYLMRHQYQVVSRESLAREVWNEPGRSAPLDNVIDAHIARLRSKVDVDTSTRLIHTVRGVGFMVATQPP